MKIFTLLAIFLLSLPTFALDGTAVSLGADKALEKAGAIIDLNSVEAWGATLIEGEEVEVKVLAHDHEKDEDSLLTYGCKESGVEQSLECEKEEGEPHAVASSEGEEFAEMQALHKRSLAELADIFDGLSGLVSLKVWKVEEGHDHDHDHDHAKLSFSRLRLNEEEPEHGADVWTKAVFNFEGEEFISFVQCHVHAGDGAHHCELREEGVGEPPLSHEDHDHDDHGDHDDHDHDDHDDHDHDHDHEGSDHD